MPSNIAPASGTRRAHQPTVGEMRAKAEATRQAQEKDYRNLYGPHFDLVQWLRPKVGMITRHGEGVKVDSRAMSFDELVEYGRKKGWTGEAPKAVAPLRRIGKTAGGLKVGDSQALTPKKTARKLSGAAAVAQAKALEHSADLGTKPRVVWRAS